MIETTFANTPRIKDKPFSKRIGNNLLERDNEGSVSCFIGYFNPSQVLARKLYEKKLQECMKAGQMKLYKGSFNYYGETINLWTHAHSKEQAFTYFIKELAFQLDRTRISVSNYFLSGKDNYLIEEKKRRAR